jgi:hypothetical protein
MATREPKFKVGQTIEWKSQATGSWRTKTGKVVAVLQPSQSARAALEKLDKAVSARVNACDKASTVRYLVEMPRAAKAMLTDFMVPDIARAEKHGRVV